MAAAAFALLHAATHGHAMGSERVLLRESFEACDGRRLPEGWSSSHERFLLWPDFVASRDAAAGDGCAAVAGNVSGDAWLLSPPVGVETYAGVQVRCRLRVSRAAHARVWLELSSEDGSLLGSAARLSPRGGGYEEFRVPVDLRGLSGRRIAVRWRVHGDPAEQPVAVRLDEVLVAGMDARECEEMAVAAGDAAFPGAVVINEIMYAPGSGEPEWIELLNPGDSAVNMWGWTVSDASAARSNPFPAITVPPGGTLVITRDLTQFTLARGLPRCQAAAPGSLPSLNNGGDAVIVSTAGGTVVDSVPYHPSWGGASGRSLERRDPRSTSDRENWGECEDSSGATPCTVNSIAVLPVDICISLKAGYRLPYGAPRTLDAAVRNAGSEPVRDIGVRWFIDEDRDAAPDDGEQVASRVEAGPLGPGDSIAVTAEWTGARPGVHMLIALADVAGDDRPGNNLAHATVIVGQPPGVAVVNEIMYQPLPGESEYIELAADAPLALDGWSLLLGLRGDGKPGKTIALKGGGDAGQSYMVVASDSSVVDRFGHLGGSSGESVLLVAESALGLNNAGELIRLVDPSGGTVDSVMYDPDWHDPAFTDVSGRALEKVHPRLDGTARQSWSTSVDPAGGTPGMQNSIVAPPGRQGSGLHADPNPFSPDGDGHQDHTIVSYRLAADAGYTVIRVFSVTGRLIRTLMERERGGFAGETVWDGRDDRSRRVRMGTYILHLEAYDGAGAMVAAVKTAVAVSGRL